MKKFFAGMICAFALESLQQDYMGKEAYIVMAQNHWISGYITVPLAIFNLFLAFVIYNSVYIPPKKKSNYQKRMDKI